MVVLRITDFYLSTNPLGSHVHLAVKGEVINTHTDVAQLVSDWSFIGESVDPAELAENKSELLKSQMKKAWAEISWGISANIFP